jgi:hypothetical protein
MTWKNEINYTRMTFIASRILFSSRVIKYILENGILLIVVAPIVSGVLVFDTEGDKAN